MIFELNFDKDRIYFTNVYHRIQIYITFVPLSEKEVCSAVAQHTRDKVANGEWGGIGNGIALSYSTDILCCYI